MRLALRPLIGLVVLTVGLLGSPTPYDAGDLNARSDAGASAADLAPALDGQAALRVAQIGGDRTVPLVAGWNLVGWTAGSTPAIDAIAPIADAVETLFVYDAAAQAFRAFSPDRPAFLNTIGDIGTGDGVWILANRSTNWEQPAVAGLRLVALLPGFNLEMWTGPDGTDPASAFAGLGSGLVTAFSWDESNQAFRSYAPDRAAFLNDMVVLNHGDGVWLELSTPATWLQPARGGTTAKASRHSTLDYVDHRPPIASLITVSEAESNGRVSVVGAPGSVMPNAAVLVASLSFVDQQFTTSAADGSFQISTQAAPGATITVRYDPFNRTGPEQELHQTNRWPGTLIPVPDGDSHVGGGARFTSTGFIQEPAGLIRWSVEGVLVDRTLLRGEDAKVSGTLTLYPAGPVNFSASLSPLLELSLQPLFNAQGEQVAPGTVFISHLLTPSGAPIERGPRPGIHLITEPLNLSVQGAVVRGTFEVDARIPDFAPDGTYRLSAALLIPFEISGLAHELEDQPSAVNHDPGATLGIVTVGSAMSPRLTPLLLADTPNQGQRGVIAEEDENRVGFANQIVTASDQFVIQPRDPGSGSPISYRLEPFLPILSLADRNLPDQPPIPFDLPGGTLSVVVKTPSGETDALGSHPILQTRTGHAATSAGLVVNNGGSNPGGILQLTTLSDDFAYQFLEYGLYEIQISGSVPDIWGTSYALNGSYEVWVAETLDLQAAALPGTPFVVGDQLPAAITLFPGVPARVEWNFALYPIDGSAVIHERASGTANRFGYFDGAGQSFALSTPGEYAVTIAASYTDHEGRLWMATRRWGSGVAGPGPAFLARGTRGIDSEESGRQAWFLRSGIDEPDAVGHISFPYFSGDVVWATDDDASQQRITIDDPSGEVRDLIVARRDQSDTEFGDRFDERIALGEIPLILSTSTGIDAATDPDAIDQWGYAYRAVQRPDVRVRETVAVDAASAPYWRFEDTYLLQYGAGAAGDLPNDLKWQFGAAVFKRPELGMGEVAVYGSLWVAIPNNDPLGSRVFPPFQGAASGPSGGPVLTLKGEEIDIFFMPATVAPGAVLEVGEQFVPAGQIGPPLPSRVSYRIVAPSGRIHTISGRANAIGYYADSTSAFVVDEPGLWTVELTVLHDGLTSAGPVEPPFPSGSILGAANGQYHFFVLPTDAPALDVGLPQFSIAEVFGGIEEISAPDLVRFTEDPKEVLAGKRSLVGSAFDDEPFHRLFGTPPGAFDFRSGDTYQVAFDYRVVPSPLGGGGKFILSLFSEEAWRQDVHQPVLEIDESSGSAGRGIYITTLRDFSDYALALELFGQGSIVIDNFSLVDLTTGEVLINDDLESDVVFQVKVPDGWRDVSADYVIAMPGFVLERGSATPDNGSVAISYDPVALHDDFPNIDLTARHDHVPGLADEIFVSVLISGIDQSGQPVYAAKHLTLVGEDIYNLN